MEEEKKKSGKGGLVVIIIILLLLCCAMGALLFLNKDVLLEKYFNKTETTEEENTDNKESEEKEEIEEIDIKSAIVINLFNTFRMDKACWMTPDGLNKDNKVKLRLAYESVIDNYDMIPCSKVGGTISGSYCGGDFWGDKEISNAYLDSDKTRFTQLIEERVQTRSIKQEVLKAKVLELFGNNYDYKDEDFGTGHEVEARCHLMHYVPSEGVYAAYGCEGGGTCSGKEQEVTKAYKQGENLYIETNYKTYENEAKTEKVTYEFQKDKVNSNYAFVKVTKE